MTAKKEKKIGKMLQAYIDALSYPSMRMPESANKDKSVHAAKLDTNEKRRLSNNRK